MSTATSEVQPIAFDNTAQLGAVLDKIRLQLQYHIDSACRGREDDPTFKTELQAVMERDILDALPGMIQQNITVKGMSWDEYADSNNHEATQPLDHTLLQSTIRAQDAAFQMSTLNCAKRTTKPALLASQVDSRVKKVVVSGEVKSTLLEEQKQRRAARRRLVGGEVPAKQETAADLQAAEALLARCGPAMTLQNEKAERAASVARDVERLLERQTQRQLSTSSQLRR